MARMTKMLLAPVVLVACAYSWLTYFWSRPADKESYWADAWGWTSPRMDPAWEDWRLRTSTFHELKNLGAEWARAWPQTAAKAGSFIALALLLVGLILGGILGYILPH
jgi:hypothetical protein